VTVPCRYAGESGLMVSDALLECHASNADAVRPTSRQITLGGTVLVQYRYYVVPYSTVGHCTGRFLNGGLS